MERYVMRLGRLHYILSCVLLLIFASAATAQKAKSLPAGQVGKPYSVTVKAGGGLAPLTWKVTAGKFPPGLSPSPHGNSLIIEGTPTKATRSPFIFTLQVTDSSNPVQTATMQFSLVIEAQRLRIIGVVSAPSKLKITGVSPTSGNTAKSRQGGNQTGTRPKGPCSTPPLLNGPIREGDTRVSGSETDPAKKVRVEVTVKFNGNVVPQVTTWAQVANGQFAVNLGRPLRAGEEVTAQEFCGDTAGPPSAEEEVYSAEWGRTRPYFYFGVVFSQENGQFSKQDLYLGLTMDSNWFQSRRWAFNTYFDARLTSIPVAVAPSQPPASGSLETFIGSRKAAQVGGGFYVPLYIPKAEWNFDDRQNALFIAPIVKGGIFTLTGGAESVQTQSASPTGATTTTTLGSNDFYHFYAAGLRLGHQKLYGSGNVAPELLSYLDITLGKWENFEQCVPPSCKIAAQGGASDPEFPTLLGLEGRLKIPRLPAYVGFDSITPIKGPGRGDLRFLFGTQFDIGPLFQKLGLDSSGTAQIPAARATNASQNQSSTAHAKKGGTGTQPKL